MKPTPPRSARFPEIRCTAAELAEIKRRAEAAKQTVSEYVRTRALRGRRVA